MKKNKYPVVREQIFYSDPKLGEKRKMSLELDFGVHWKNGSMFPVYRVTWVEKTGEVIAFNEYEKTIQVLGVVSTREEIEKKLSGWADICGEIDSLHWVRSKLRT